VLESCSTAELVERRAPAVLLSLIPEFSSARQKHDVWTGPKKLFTRQTAQSSKIARNVDQIITTWISITLKLPKSEQLPQISVLIFPPRKSTAME